MGKWNHTFSVFGKHPFWYKEGIEKGHTRSFAEMAGIQTHRILLVARLPFYMKDILYYVVLRLYIKSDSRLHRTQVGFCGYVIRYPIKKVITLSIFYILT